MQIWNVVKNFQCACGKDFTNSQSFNGHKCHCEVHQFLKYGKQGLEAVKGRHYKASVAAQASIKAASAIKRETEVTRWLNEKHTCEKCHKVMTEKYGSGRFCSRACANSHILSEETKQKIKVSLDKTLAKQHKPVSRNKKFCSICKTEIKSYNKTGLCRNCLDHTAEGLKVKQELGRKGYATRQEHGTHKGWQSRNITSYAEQFWMQVLDNNNIEYRREVPVKHDKSNYFLDFVIEHNGKLIDLEIDGKQHTYEDRIKSDVIRDGYLTKQGYLVYRITWNEIKSEAGANEMKGKINTFLAFYNSL